MNARIVYLLPDSLRMMIVTSIILDFRNDCVKNHRINGPN